MAYPIDGSRSFVCPATGVFCVEGRCRVASGAHPGRCIERETEMDECSETESLAWNGRGDRAFLVQCEHHLNLELNVLAKDLLSSVRDRYPGELLEGLARKWVNHPSNFFALTIQNRDQSLAVHVKGEPKWFTASTLAIKRDRGCYSRFKLTGPTQLEDALRVVLASARLSHG